MRLLFDRFTFRCMLREEFATFHRHALEADEIRHGLLLSVIDHLHEREGAIRTWTLGGPGECAVQTPGYPIILGNLTKAQCSAFADKMQGDDYAGVIGAEDAPLHFIERAEELGVEFSEKLEQHIQALTVAPQVPSTPGRPRQVSMADFNLFRSWVLAFIREAVPDDPVPSDDLLRSYIKSRRYWLWSYEDKPVAMAAIARRMLKTGSINSVFTPVEYRNRGFGAAVTAYVARQIFAEGRLAACLYTDLRNKASNRCYAKLGFRPYCKSWHMVRRQPAQIAC